MNRESERKRLVELLKLPSNCMPHSKCESCGLNGGCSVQRQADKILADGWMRPPVKVGQTVYLIKDGFIERCEVEGIHYTRRSNYVRIRPYRQEYLGNWSIYYKPSISSFGKTVFPTREDAEKALKGEGE